MRELHSSSSSRARRTCIPKDLSVSTCAPDHSCILFASVLQKFVKECTQTLSMVNSSKLQNRKGNKNCIFTVIMTAFVAIATS